jgi:hypothetical protein
MFKFRIVYVPWVQGNDSDFHLRKFATFCVAIIIIIIIIILGISFMQGIYTYILETNHVPREHRVAAIHGAYIASSCVYSIVSLR